MFKVKTTFFNYQEDWLENNIYQEMALTASAFAYTWSKWNADCGKDKIIIQAVEQLQDEQPLEVATVNLCKSISSIESVVSDNFSVLRYGGSVNTRALQPGGLGHGDSQEGSWGPSSSQAPLPASTLPS